MVVHNDIQRRKGTRLCLKCLKYFKSTHIHNRVCYFCRKRNEKVLTGALQDIHLCIGSSKIAQISLHIEILQDKEALKDETDI